MSQRRGERTPTILNELLFFHSFQLIFLPMVYRPSQGRKRMLLHSLLLSLPSLSSDFSCSSVPTLSTESTSFCASSPCNQSHLKNQWLLVLPALMWITHPAGSVQNPSPFLFLVLLTRSLPLFSLFLNSFPPCLFFFPFFSLSLFSQLS